MTSSSAQLEERALDLAWSLWAELGVSGWQRRHTSHAIDPDLLLLFTSFLGDADPRLRDESTDWCITYGRYVSKTRLKNLLAGEQTTVKEAFGPTAATVNAHSNLRWPGATVPRPFRPTERSAVPDFRRPSLVVLRLRALFGVGARAEIVRAFAADTPAGLSAADLADEAGYTKRNIAEALEVLRMAGLLEAERRRNRLVYRLADAEGLMGMLGNMPLSFPNWRSVFRILERFITASQRGASLKPRAAAVEVSDVLHDLEADLRAVGARMPRLDVQSPDPWSGLMPAVLDLAEAWSRGSMSAVASGH